MGPKRKNIEDRFWKKVEVKSVRECWLWTANTNGKYGILKAGTGRANTYAHRLSWELKNGKIPRGMLICHHCDNPICVNPDHLFLGTAKDNVQDMIRKGRGGTIGIKHPLRKLNVSDVVAIRSSKDSIRKLAERYMVHHEQIRRVKKHMSWKTVNYGEYA